MRFKDDNDNRYRVNFTRATEAHIDKMTVAEFIEYLENNAEFEDESTPIYIDGKTIWCKDCILKETYKLRKEFLVSEDGSRLFYSISVIKRAELVDDSTEAAADNERDVYKQMQQYIEQNVKEIEETEEPAKPWEEQERTVTLTNELCSTLQCYILMTTNYRKGELKAWEELAQEKNEYGAPKFKNAANNAQFWRDMEIQLQQIYTAAG